MDKSATRGKGYCKTFKHPEVRRPITVRGGLSLGEHILKSVDVNQKTFVEVLQYSDWLTPVVAGKNRRNDSFENCEVWDAFRSQLTPSADGVEDGDAFSAVVAEPQGSQVKRRTGRCQVLTLQEVRVQPPNYEGHITVLGNGPDSAKVLWVLESDLPAFLTLLANHFARKRGEDAMEVEQMVSNQPEYKQGSRQWVLRWRTATGELQESSVKVDNRKRQGKEVVGVVDADVFLRRKATARKQLKRKALDLGCADLSESEDDTQLPAADGGA